MQKKLYIGGLSWNTDSEALNQAFLPFGEIEESKVIFDRDTGRSRGFGFVTFATQESAEKALKLDGTELDGRTIRVSFARDKGGRRGGGPRW